MPDKDEFLREKTFKGEYDTTSERVFYCVWDDDRFRDHRCARLLGFLTQRLIDKGLLTEEELDDELLSMMA